MPFKYSGNQPQNSACENDDAHIAKRSLRPRHSETFFGFGFRVTVGSFTLLRSLCTLRFEGLHGRTLQVARRGSLFLLVRYATAGFGAARFQRRCSRECVDRSRGVELLCRCDDLLVGVELSVDCDRSVLSDRIGLHRREPTIDRPLRFTEVIDLLRQLGYRLLCLSGARATRTAQGTHYDARND